MPSGTPRALRRLGQRRVEVVEEDDDRAQVGIQATERALEDVAIRGLRLRIRHVEVMDRRDLDLDRSRPAPPQLVVAGMHQEAVEPGVEPVGIAKGPEIPPGLGERLLDGVLGLVGIAQDQPGGAIEPADRGEGERVEGVEIAPTCPLHEFPLRHALPRLSRVVGVALTRYGGWKSPSVRQRHSLCSVEAGNPARQTS